MPKQLHINMIIDLPDDHWRESEVKSAVKPLYDQFSQALTDAGITFQDAVKVMTPRPPREAKIPAPIPPTISGAVPSPDQPTLASPAPPVAA